MRKYCLVFVSILFVFGLCATTGNAKKDKPPKGCGELGECSVAVDCEENNPGVDLAYCEQWSCNVDFCCEVDTTGCPDCYGAPNVTVIGGGPGSKKIDKQVMVFFYSVDEEDSGIYSIVDSTDDSITVCEPARLIGTVWAGQGPLPSTITFNGVPLEVEAGGIIRLDVQNGDTLYVDNLDNGGRDIDQITIYTTNVNP